MEMLVIQGSHNAIASLDGQSRGPDMYELENEIGS